MRIVVAGGTRGIGGAVADLCRERGDTVVAFGRSDANVRSCRGCVRCDRVGPDVHARDDLAVVNPDALVCCNGDHYEAVSNCFWATIDYMGRFRAPIIVTMSGGGVGGPVCEAVMPREYIAAKAAVVALTEWYAARDPHGQYFCVAPGQTATRMTNGVGVDPRIPAAFIVKLLSGKYGRLSGSLLAAQRDNLDTMKPMKLRRVET